MLYCNEQNWRLRHNENRNVTGTDREGILWNTAEDTLMIGLGIGQRGGNDWNGGDDYPKFHGMKTRGS